VPKNCNPLALPVKPIAPAPFVNILEPGVREECPSDIPPGITILPVAPSDIAAADTPK